MNDIENERRSTNYGFLMLDYGEGGDHIGRSSNIFERQSTIQSYTTGVSVGSPIGLTRQAKLTVTGDRFIYKYFYYCNLKYINSL